MSYGEFLERAVKNIQDSKSPVEIYVAGYQMGNLCGALGSLDVQGVDSETIKKDLEARLSKIILEKDPVNNSDVRRIMEDYGESLTDLEADYSDEFMEWMQSNHSEIYDSWHEDYKKEQDEFIERFRERLRFPDKELNESELELSETFLFEYSNSSLRGNLSSEEHDKYLAEFANQNLKANKHLRGLLSELEKD